MCGTEQWPVTMEALCRSNQGDKALDVRPGWIAPAEGEGDAQSVSGGSDARGIGARKGHHRKCGRAPCRCESPVINRFSLEVTFHDLKEVLGVGQQQVRRVRASVGAFHVCLWTFTVTEAWAWNLSCLSRIWKTARFGLA